MLLLGVILSIVYVGRPKLVKNTQDAYVSSRVLQSCQDKQTRHASSEEVNRNRNAIIPSPTALESRYEQHGRDRVLEIGEMLSSRFCCASSNFHRNPGNVSIGIW